MERERLKFERKEVAQLLTDILTGPARLIAFSRLMKSKLIH